MKNNASSGALETVKLNKFFIVVIMTVIDSFARFASTKPLSHYYNVLRKILDDFLFFLIS